MNKSRKCLLPGCEGIQTLTPQVDSEMNSVGEVWLCNTHARTLPAPASLLDSIEDYLKVTSGLLNRAKAQDMQIMLLKQQAEGQVKELGRLRAILANYRKREHNLLPAFDNGE